MAADKGFEVPGRERPALPDGLALAFRQGQVGMAWMRKRQATPGFVSTLAGRTRCLVGAPRGTI